MKNYRTSENYFRFSFIVSVTFIALLSLVSSKKDTDLPIVETGLVTHTTSNMVQAKVHLTTSSGAKISEIGICYNDLKSEPDFYDLKVVK